VRRINGPLPQTRKLRVLACDPPIDWSKVKGPQDLTPFMDRDANIAAVLENEVLSKHRKALMLFGWDHVLHGGGAVGIYEQRYPGVTFSIVNHEGFARDNDEMERRMASWPVPSLTPVEETWLAGLDSSYFGLPPGQKGYPGADGYLYLGPRDFLLHQPISSRTVLDSAYIAELQQRAVTIQAPAEGRRIQRHSSSAKHNRAYFSMALASSPLAEPPEFHRSLVRRIWLVMAGSVILASFARSTALLKMIAKVWSPSKGRATPGSGELDAGMMHR
jgi:hypothetical protein